MQDSKGKTSDNASLPHGHYRTTQTNWDLLPPYIKFRYELVSKYLPMEGDIFELGCGIGVCLHHLASKHPNLMFYGYDISSDAVNFGNSQFKLPNLKLSAINSSDELPQYLQDKSFLIALEVLEHLNNEQLDYFKKVTMQKIDKIIFSFPYNQQNIEGTDHLQSFDIYKIFEIFPGFETLFIRGGSIKFIGKWERASREYVRHNLGIPGEDKSIARIENLENLQ